VGGDNGGTFSKVTALGERWVSLPFTGAVVLLFPAIVGAGRAHAAMIDS
jgi:hypothetical protein